MMFNLSHGFVTGTAAASPRGMPPRGLSAMPSMYNHNISTLKMNIIKTYSYLYAVYSTGTYCTSRDL
jgi:hypothetical protein